MTVSDLKKRLEKMPESAIVNLMIEVDSRYEGDNIVPRHQLEFPANDLAFSRGSNTVIIMHEKFNGEDHA